MPKLKTNKSAAKRFKRTASGNYKHRAANRNHILTKKAKKRKVQLRPMLVVNKSDIESVAKMLRDKT
jgi:large subunit ribosomal protein L35